MSAVLWSPNLKSMVSSLKSLNRQEIESALTDGALLRNWTPTETETNMLKETFLKPTGQKKGNFYFYWL